MPLGGVFPAHTDIIVGEAGFPSVFMQTGSHQLLGYRTRRDDRLRAMLGRR